MVVENNTNGQEVESMALEHPIDNKDIESNSNIDISIEEDTLPKKEESINENNNSEEDNDTNLVGDVTTNGDETSTTENSESDTETETESEDDDEEPPLLTYSRIKGLPIRLFERDAISVCNFHESIYIFGTHSGLLFFTTPSFEIIETLKCHRSSILSIYTDGISFATASIDGTIVTGLVENIRSDDLMAFDFKRPINAVVLDTNYRTTKTFVSGGMAGELVLSQRNWLGNRTDSVISKGDGPILSIYKSEEILFWFTSSGIHFYDVPSRKLLLNIPLPDNKNNNNSFDLSRPHVHIPERDIVVVGWMDHVWTFKISLARNNSEDSFVSNNIGSMLSSAASSFKAMPDKEVELENDLVIPMLISGITSFKDDQLLCLGYEKQYDKKHELILKALTPQLKIFNIINGSEIYNDEIVCKNYDKLALNDYHLGKYVDPKGTNPAEYYLICSTDAIKIQELSLRDHYNWFLTRKKYYEAWKIGQYVVDNLERADVGINYVNVLLENDEWDQVGSMVVKIFSDISELSETSEPLQDLYYNEWHNIIMIALKINKIEIIADYIPQDLNLKDSIYDRVLIYCLDNNHRVLFSKLINIWKVDLFHILTLEERLQTSLNDHDEDELYYLDQIISLYLKEERFSKAVPYMITKKDDRVLDILNAEPQIIPQVSDKLIEIVLIPYLHNKNFSQIAVNDLSIKQIETIFYKPIELLVRNINVISISKIISIFTGYKKEGSDIDKLLLCIFERIDSRDPTELKVFENEIIDLYARFENGPLLNFLKTKSNYNVEDAIKICSSQSGLYHELIYLWGRIGESKKALSIIIDELNDPSLAIEFVRSWGDIELWNFLIEYTINKSNFVKALLDSYDYLGDKYVDVVRYVDDDSKISEISTPVIETLMETSRSYQVNENIFKIVDNNTSKYAIRLLELRYKGKLYDNLNTSR